MKYILILALALTLGVPVVAQQRVAVLPFRNMEREIQLNYLSMQLADSLYKAILAVDPGQKDVVLIPPDSIEMAIAELNLDPTNPQYESDMWKAIRSLGATRAVQGNFQLRNERIMVNCYVYDLESMLADQQNQAKDLFKPAATVLETIRPIVKKIYPGLK